MLITEERRKKNNQNQTTNYRRKTVSYTHLDVYKRRVTFIVDSADSAF